MNGNLEDVKKYDARPSGSPVRVKADPDLLSDVSVNCPTPSRELPERTSTEQILDWDSVVADLPSDDEDG